MKNKLKSIIYDMGVKAFTIDEKTDYLLQHDVVPVVRCKDCMNCYFTRNGGADICMVSGWETEEDDFCSYGERKVNND